MREQVISNLATVFPRTAVEDLFGAYEGMVRKFHASDYEGCLNRAGKFVEHCLRCLEYVRTGVLPSEIKSASRTISDLRTAKGLSDSVSVLIPGVLGSMIYDVRSKKGAVHVKEVDPAPIDATLAITAASWAMSELLRLYHTADQRAVRMYLSSLMRSKAPYIETIGDELVVTKKVPTLIEVALLLSSDPSAGMSRNQVGRAAGCSPASVTKSLVKLRADRWAHQVSNGNYVLTGAGEGHLADWIASQPL